MTPTLIVAAIGFGWAVGFITGHLFAVSSRKRFNRSLMPATSEHTDFDEVDRDSPWGEVQRGGYHVADMRRDRVRRHPEAPATFPAGDVA